MKLAVGYMKTNVYRLYCMLFKRQQMKAFLDYKYTDEKKKLVHILEAINYVRVSGLPPIYFEFGCHSGRTFSAAIRAARHFQIKDAQFFAFDSFEGLPEVNVEQDGCFKKGQFSTSKDTFIRLVKKLSGIRLSESHIIEGFYNESLTHALQAQMPKIGVVHIDVDLYSSTKEVLNFIRPLLMVGTVILFDDWYCFSPGENKGEQRALHEFLEGNPNFSIQEWKSYSTFGKSFFVTSVS